MQRLLFMSIRPSIPMSASAACKLKVNKTKGEGVKRVRGGGVRLLFMLKLLNAKGSGEGECVIAALVYDDSSCH